MSKRWAAVAVGGTVALVCALGATGVWATEKATVTITPPVRFVQGAQVTLHGALSGGDFQTQRLRVDMTETMTGTATGVSTAPARYATGYVVFTHSCWAPLPGQPCQATPPVAAGNVLWNNQGTMTYVLLATVSCFCGERVPVRAWSMGPNGNTAAHTVSLYVRTNGFTPFEYADNPAPIAGGRNATSTPIVQASDIDVARTALESRLAADLASALETKAGTLRYLADRPAIQVSANVAAGSPSASFVVTAAGAQTATAYDDAIVRSLLAGSMLATLPRNWESLAAPSVTELAPNGVTANGDVTITGSAAGYVTERVTLSSLGARLRGLTPAAAQQLLVRAFPGAAVEVRLFPIATPWLPPGEANIEVVVAQPRL